MVRCWSTTSKPITINKNWVKPPGLFLGLWLRTGVGCGSDCSVNVKIKLSRPEIWPSDGFGSFSISEPKIGRPIASTSAWILGLFHFTLDEALRVPNWWMWISLQIPEGLNKIGQNCGGESKVGKMTTPISQPLGTCAISAGRRIPVNNTAYMSEITPRNWGIDDRHGWYITQLYQSVGSASQDISFTSVNTF